MYAIDPRTMIIGGKCTFINNGR